MPKKQEESEAAQSKAESLKTKRVEHAFLSFLRQQPEDFSGGNFEVDADGCFLLGDSICATTLKGGDVDAFFEGNGLTTGASFSLFIHGTKVDINMFMVQVGDGLLEACNRSMDNFFGDGGFMVNGGMAATFCNNGIIISTSVSSRTGEHVDAILASFYRNTVDDFCYLDNARKRLLQWSIPSCYTDPESDQYNTTATVSENGTLLIFKPDSTKAPPFVLSEAVMVHGKHFWEMELGIESDLGSGEPGFGYDSAVGLVQVDQLLGGQSNHLSSPFWGMNLNNGICCSGELQSTMSPLINSLFNTNERIGLLFDLDDGSLQFTKNGQIFGDGYPAGTITGPVAVAVCIGAQGSILLLPDHVRSSISRPSLKEIKAEHEIERLVWKQMLAAHSSPNSVSPIFIRESRRKLKDTERHDAALKKESDANQKQSDIAYEELMKEENDKQAANEARTSKTKCKGKGKRQKAKKKASRGASGGADDAQTPKKGGSACNSADAGGGSACISHGVGDSDITPHEIVISVAGVQGKRDVEQQTLAQRRLLQEHAKTREQEQVDVEATEHTAHELLKQTRAQHEAAEQNQVLKQLERAKLQREQARREAAEREAKKHTRTLERESFERGKVQQEQARHKALELHRAKVSMQWKQCEQTRREAAEHEAKKHTRTRTVEREALEREHEKEKVQREQAQHKALEVERERAHREALGDESTRHEQFQREVRVKAQSMFVANENEAPDEYHCPITMELMEYPVFASDGYTYEQAAIEAWFARVGASQAFSPKTNTAMPNQVRHTYISLRVEP
jgi:hypothetical protein